jgi:predicted flavoprotein YhiN
MDLDLSTLVARNAAGLSFVGEVMDGGGRPGGYNSQWVAAWMRQEQIATAP